MIFFKEIILFLISQAAVLDVHYMSANSTLNELKLTANQNIEPKLLIDEIKRLINKLEGELKQLKEANEQVVRRINKREFPEVNALYKPIKLNNV